MFDRLISLTRKEFIQIVRDPRTLYMTFMIPIVMLILLGYAATNDVSNIGLVIFDQDHTASSRALVDAFRSSDYFTIAGTVDSEEQIRQLIDRNSARAGIVIPPGYEKDIQRGGSGEVSFVLDGSDPTVAGTALSAAIMIGQTQSAKITQERFTEHGLTALAATPIDMRTQVWYNPGMVSAYYMIPALIGIILQFMTTMLTSSTIVRERERGTIEQLIVTPLHSWELVVGKLVPYVLISFIDTLEILVLGVLLFKVPINGNLALLLVLIGLFLVTTLGLGLLISTMANTQQEAMMTTIFTIMPSIFLSGFFFPIAAMPTWLQIVSYTIPLRYFLVIARGIILKGVGIEALWGEVIALALFAVVVMGAAAARFRKSLD